MGLCLDGGSTPPISTNFRKRSLRDFSSSFLGKDGASLKSFCYICSMMKDVDNFKLISELLEWPSEEDDGQHFFFVQLLIRKKDGNREQSGNNKNRLVKSYAIRSRDELFLKEQEIKAICKLTNARAYIHPAIRTWKGVAGEMLKECTSMYVDQNFSGFRNLFEAAAGKTYKDKRWVVDLDDDMAGRADEIEEFIEKECRPFDNKKVLGSVLTVHGVHLITRAFDLSIFRQAYSLIDVHTNNPTLLYYCKED